MFDESLIEKKDRDVTRKNRELFIIEAIRKLQPANYNQIRDFVVHESKQMPIRIFDNIMKDLRERGLVIEIKIGQKIYFSIPASIRPIDTEKLMVFARQGFKEIDEYLRILAKTYPQLPFKLKAEVALGLIASLTSQSLSTYLLSLPVGKDSKKYREISDELERRIEKMAEIIFADEDADMVYCFVLLNLHINAPPRNKDAVNLLKLISSTQQFKHLE